MRVPAILLALSIAAPAASAGPAPAEPVEAPAEPVEKPRDRTVLQAQKADDCPRTTSYYARKHSMYRGAPPTPKKLTELPPATGFMAVYRTINGCEVPMTMVEYRTGRRP